MEMFLQLVVSGLANGAVYSLIALTICIIFKGTDVINFATGEAAMFGAFIAFTFAVVWKLPFPLTYFVAGLVIPVIMGFSIERFVARPLIRGGHMTVVIGTFALSFALRGLARRIWGSDFWSLPSMLGTEPISISIGGNYAIILSRESLVMLIASPIAMIVFSLFFKHFKLGKMMRASQENFVGASLVGINIYRMFSFTWVIGCIMASWAGLLLAPASLVYVEMGAKVTFKGFAALVLGGFGVIPGAIIGGFMMGLIEALFSGYITTSMTDLSSFLVIFFIMCIRPTGILGKKKIEKL